MNRKYKSRSKTIISTYLLGLLGMLLIIGIIIIDREERSETIQEITYKNVTADWTLDREGLEAADVKKLGEYMDEEKGILSLYYQLPEMNADVSLVYRSKDVYTRVLVGEDVIYETEVYDSKYYNKSPGNLWNVLTVNSKYSGACLELQIIMVYDTDALTVDSMLLGDKADIILGLFADNMYGIVVSLLMILLGVGLIVVDLLPSYGRAKKNHSMLWIGLFALITGGWSLLETNVIQFCVKDMRILQLINNMFIVVDSMPLLLYLNSEYKVFQNRILRILAYINTGYILLCVFIQLEGTWDLHHMLLGGILIMVAIDIVTYIWVTKMLIKLKKENKPIFQCAMQITGLCSLWFFTVFETVRSLNVDRMDRSGLIRVGMLIMCLCFAISSQVETYKIVEQGLKYDLVTKLAYSDGLTGLGNRTAYLEQLDEYVNPESNIKSLGIIYLDVNNLKTVNDNQGHEMGDNLIQIASHIISDSFGHYGKTYRIGGDEFCVFITGINIEEKYKKGLLVFNELITEANLAKWYPYPIQIAHGFSICQEFTRDKIDEAIAIADSEMYHNKQEIKNNK
ncbi:MAG: GGDEF domain-containing protein [Lachnospiraceae bacterium]|nr:GGDEF domain-containing protein [Lachnospiraceae bacterium]